MSGRAKGNNERLPETGDYFDANIGYNVVRPDGVYQGMTYGNWLPSWAGWLFSQQPDLFTGNHLMFLRKGIGDAAHVKVGDRAAQISPGTAVLVPVHFICHQFGDYYDGMRLEDEIGLRRAVRNDISHCDYYWAEISREDKGLAKRLVPDLGQFYFESPMFDLNVSELNPLKDKFPVPMKSGANKTVVGGYFVLLKPTTAKIRLWFGSSSSESRSEATYDIRVNYEKKLMDMSGRVPTPSTDETKP